MEKTPQTDITSHPRAGAGLSIERYFTTPGEHPFDTVLNHWDETVAYAALFCLVSSFNHSVSL